jgi:hypothetical protein
MKNMEKEYKITLIVFIMLGVVLAIFSFYAFDKEDSSLPGDSLNSDINGDEANNVDNPEDNNYVNANLSNPTTNNNSNEGSSGSGGSGLMSSDSAKSYYESIGQVLPSDIDSRPCGFYAGEYSVCAGTCPTGECIIEGRSCYCKLVSG